jgi:hypothetical protein
LNDGEVAEFFRRVTECLFRMWTNRPVTSSVTCKLIAGKFLLSVIPVLACIEQINHILARHTPLVVLAVIHIAFFLLQGLLSTSAQRLRS